MAVAEGVTRADRKHSTGAIVDALNEVREQTLALVSLLSPEALETVYSRPMSPIAWDLGHIATFEDLWLVHNYGGEQLLRPDLVKIYNAFDTPRPKRGDLPLLRAGECLEYLEAVRGRTLAVIGRDGTRDGVLHEMVLRHELQHNETIMQTLQLARIEFEVPDYMQTVRVGSSFDEITSPPTAQAIAAGPGSPEMVEVAGGAYPIGATGEGFAYDNERPSHEVTVNPFLIGQTAVTNGAYEEFVAGGGYDRRELWSDEGWAWRSGEGAERPLYWTRDGREWCFGRYVERDPSKPVSHVSWFEADAFARSRKMRLPTELEWEVAATWDPARCKKQDFPWGSELPDSMRANLDRLAMGPVRADAYPAGASPCGCLGTLGNVWEWTSSFFQGYPGFKAHPYKEYSEVFFGSNYLVLRGGSWVTASRAATPTLRNWDFPQRRQIFCGFRLACDAS